MAGQKELDISYREHCPVSLIYMDQQGVISQRVVQVTGYTENGVQAYCYQRREPRTFLYESILAASLNGRKQGRRLSAPGQTDRGSYRRAF